MSHSRIFQIMDKPVPPEEYITESEYDEHWFVGSIADSVSSNNDRNEDINELRSWLESKKVAVFNTKDGAFTILPEGKQSYFTDSYKAFVAARDKTLKMGLPQFASDGAFSDAVWQMSNALKDKFGYYVVSDVLNETYPDPVPFDDFIRRAKAGKRYYIGGTLDYHY